MMASTFTRLGRIVGLLVFAFVACIPLVHGNDGASPEQQIQSMLAELSSLENSTELTPAGRDARIASVVRMTVVRATHGQTDSAVILARASQITNAAMRAVPAAGENILNAVALAPVIARLDNGAERLRQSLANAEGATMPAAEPPLPDYAPSPVVKPAIKRQTSANTFPPADKRTNKEEARPNVSESAASEEPSVYADDPALRFSLGESTSFDLSADVGIEHDNNIFLTATNKVADTIIRVSPGISFLFGRSALTNGSVSYQQSFLSYADNSADRVSLAAGSLQFGYGNGRTSASFGLSYRQLNQNDRDLAGVGDRTLRRDLFDSSLGVELALGGKFRLGTGTTLSNTNYRRTELTDNRQIELPLKVFLALTPKTSVSVGASYRNVRVLGDQAATIPNRRDMFYNLGVRGALAPKLTGEFAFGYRTRDGEGSASGAHLWGFDGALNLAIGAKSSLSFQLKRDFDVGARGESLNNDRYTLNFTANPLDQWSLGSAVSYFTADYAASPATGNAFREDRFWEASMLTSYTFTSWLAAGAEYSVRNNSSNSPTAEYSNNVLKLNMRFRY